MFYCSWVCSFLQVSAARGLFASHVRRIPRNPYITPPPSFSLEKKRKVTHTICHVNKVKRGRTCLRPSSTHRDPSTRRLQDGAWEQLDPGVAPQAGSVNTGVNRTPHTMTVGTRGMLHGTQRLTPKEIHCYTPSTYLTHMPNIAKQRFGTYRPRICRD